MTDFPSRYRTGDDELDAEIAALAERVDPADRELIFEMVVTAMRLSREDADRGDLPADQTLYLEPIAPVLRALLDD